MRTTTTNDMVFALADLGRRILLKIIHEDGPMDAETLERMAALEDYDYTKALNILFNGGWIGITSAGQFTSLVNGRSLVVKNFVSRTFGHSLGYTSEGGERLLTLQLKKLARTENSKAIYLTSRGRDWQLQMANRHNVSQIESHLLEADIITREGDLVLPPLPLLGKYLEGFGRRLI